MQHPDKNVELTDHFGRPISPGDIVVYPTVVGSSSAQLATAQVVKVVPLVEKPGHWISTGPHSRVPTVREDQLQDGRPYPTEYRVHRNGWSKAYVLVVRPKSSAGFSSHTSLIKNVHNVVVAPDV